MYPVAVKPTYVHARMGAQKSCFTIFGQKQEPMATIVPGRILAKLVMRKKALAGLRRDLNVLGVTHTTVFPETEHLAREITEIGLYRPASETEPEGLQA